MLLILIAFVIAAAIIVVPLQPNSIQWIAAIFLSIIGGLAGVAEIAGLLDRFEFMAKKRVQSMMQSGEPRPTRKSVAESLPALVLRHLYKPEGIAESLRINLRGEKPIGLNLGAEVPTLDLWLEITNLGRLDLTLDRLLVEIWFGQPTLQGAVLKRQLIPAGNISTVFFRYALNTEQRQQIQSFKDSQGAKGQIHLYLTVYLDSRVGRIEVEQQIERGEI